MRCFHCGENVPSVLSKCPRCRTDLTLLQPLDELRTGVDRLKFAAEDLTRRAAELDKQLAALHPLVVKKLTEQMAVAAESIESPPPESAAAGMLILDPEVQGIKERPGRLPAIPSLTESYSIPQTKIASAPMLDRAAELRLGQKWLMIVGVVVMVLGVGYFLKYAFDRNWVGPAGRVALAYAAGLTCLGSGEFFRRKKLDLFGLYLIGGGIAVLYFATFAAFQIYTLIPQPAAFGLMIAVTALAAALACVHDTMWLAVLGLIGGFLTPIVLSTGADNQLVLMCYMAMLNGGILAIAMFKRWNALNHWGLIFTWLLFTAWFARHYNASKFWPTVCFCNFFFLMYAFVPFVYYFARAAKHDLNGFWITIPNAIIAFGYSFWLIQRQFSTEAVAVISGGYALIFFAMAAHLYYNCFPQNVETVVVLLAKGILFLIITVPILFSQHWITIFWCAQAFALLWVALRLKHARLQTAALVLLALALGKLVFYDYLVNFGLRLPELSYARGFAAGMLERFATIGLLLAVLYRSAQMLRSSSQTLPTGDPHLPSVVNVVCLVLLFTALNIETAAFFFDYALPARFAAISVLWALFAGALMTFGFLRNSAPLRHCAIVLFAVTLLKVFLVDMARVSTPYRILSFLVVGLLLIGASYLYHRFKARILLTDTSVGPSNETQG